MCFERFKKLKTGCKTDCPRSVLRLYPFTPSIVYSHRLDADPYRLSVFVVHARQYFAGSQEFLLLHGEQLARRAIPFSHCARDIPRRDQAPWKMCVEIGIPSDILCVFAQPLTCFRSVCTSHCRCSRDAGLQERRSSNVRPSSCVLHPIHDRSFIYCLVTQHGGHSIGPTGLCCSCSFPWRCCGLIHVRLVWRRDQVQEGSCSAPSTRCRICTARA